jgi:hypothetical protein
MEIEPTSWVLCEKKASCGLLGELMHRFEAGAMFAPLTCTVLLGWPSDSLCVFSFSIIIEKFRFQSFQTLEKSSDLKKNQIQFFFSFEKCEFENCSNLKLLIV